MTRQNRKAPRRPQILVKPLPERERLALADRSAARLARADRLERAARRQRTSYISDDGLTPEMREFKQRLDAGSPVTPLEVLDYLIGLNGGPDVLTEQACERVEELMALDRPLTDGERAWVDEVMELCELTVTPQITWNKTDL